MLSLKLSILTAGKLYEFRSVSASREHRQSSAHASPNATEAQIRRVNDTTHNVMSQACCLKAGC